MSKMRDLIQIVETAETGPKHFVGTCVNSFDGDGECVIPSLGWASVSDFAVADETADELNAATFAAQVVMPADVVNAIAGHEVHYLDTESGVLMLYDADADVHYFFA